MNPIEEKKDPVTTEVEPGSEDACVTASNIQPQSPVTLHQSRRQAIAHARQCILETPVLSAGAARLWCVVSYYLNVRRDTPEAWPGYRGLAKKIGCNINTLSRWFDELKDKGCIDFKERESVNSDDYGKGRTYTVLNGQGESVYIFRTDYEIKPSTFSGRGVSKNKTVSVSKMQTKPCVPEGDKKQGSKEQKKEAATGLVSAATPNGAAEGQQPLCRALPDFAHGGGR